MPWWMDQPREGGAVGSLSLAQLRLAGKKEATVIRGDLEILSLCGTLSRDGAHLCPGSLVRTTAELVIGLLPEGRFRRELDPAMGYAKMELNAQPEL